MKQTIFGSAALAAVVAAVLLIAPTPVAGQTSADGGSANATPRMHDGQPDLNGFWYRRVAGATSTQLEDGSIVRDVGVPDPESRARRSYDPGAPTYTPEALATVNELNEDLALTDPAFSCGPPGVPRIGPPQRIVQTPREMVILYDDLNGNFFRLIPTDGRPHRTGIESSAHGDGVGHWEGDTLVIETVNFNEDTWLGDNGLFHTTDLRVTERLTREGDSLKWEATVEDPAVLVGPWTVTPRTLTLKTDDEIEEAALCLANPLGVPQVPHGNVR